MNLSRRSLAVALASVVVALPTTASATHSWGGYHWARTTSSFTLNVGDNVSSAWDAYLDTSVVDWSKSTVLDLKKVTGQANPKNCRPTTGRVEVCNSTYGNNGWLGIASISITGGTHITQGTVKLNDTYFNTATYNKPAWRNLVMCQEIGHTFGLDHQDENFSNANLGTCMDYTNDPTSNQHPNQHDYDELVTIYSHLDLSTTVGSLLGASAPAVVDHDNPSTWGRLMKSNGRLEIYERDHGHGNKTVTFVVWALDSDQKR